MAKKETTEEIMAPVKLLRLDGKAALVEWVADGKVQRGYLPSAKLSPSGEAVPAAVLENATPYGVPWADLLEFKSPASVIEAALHNAGVWTYEDARRYPQNVLSALQQALGVDVAIILATARKFELGE